MDNHEISNENWERNVTTWDHLFGLTIKVIWHESLMSSTSIHCYRYVWICVCHCKACSLPRERGVALHIHFLALASIWLQTKVTKRASFLDLSHHTTATIPQLLIMKTNRRALSITLPTRKNQFDYFLVTLLFNKMLRSAVSGFK